eukprot:TRINITY_DN17139_c0_g1_i1.p1 TRINITY_DN17139_c0_g1~~TRINITY_DN17139_c0_g1_i1.p1  ORF type:complete len:224 (+),score=81.21 TRINITY_DN17139_c0_g1_i1:24-695(+)
MKLLFVVKGSTIEADSEWSIARLKQELVPVTGIDAGRQKILGISKGKIPQDTDILSSFDIKAEPAKNKLTVLGISAEVEKETINAEKVAKKEVKQLQVQMEKEEKEQAEKEKQRSSEKPTDKLILAEFEKIIQNAGTKPVVVDFFASWCGPCQGIAPYVKQLETQYEQQAIFLKINVDSQQDIAASCGISSMPTFVFFKNGSEVKRFSGANRDLLLSTLKSLL